jgi:CRP/FNR family nitrogen fixation transcriptional regulator
MGVHTKTSPEVIGAFADSERPFSLPTWAQILAAAPRVYGRDVEIFGQQEPADCLYKVVSGAVRTFSVLRDGRRHIPGFYLAGDFFGFEANGRHALSAEAICDAKLLVIKQSVLAVLAEHDKDIARRLRGMMGGELGRAQVHVTRLIKTSSERVADFLLEMADRSPKANEIELPMSRQEIADHLGLTIETVSRTFAKFEAVAAIELPSSRHVTLRNRDALEHISTSKSRQGTRQN